MMLNTVEPNAALKPNMEARSRSKFQTLGFAQLARLGAFVFVAMCALTALSCGGTPLPDGLGVPGSQVSSQSLNVSLAGFIGGDSGDGQGSAASDGRSSQSSLATTSSGLVPGSNGVDLKDLAWNNLFTSGLSSNPLSDVEIQFYAEGESTPLTALPPTDSSGLFEHSFDATGLLAGGHLEMEMTVGETASRITLPLLNLRDGDQLGFNAIRRQDGTMIAELFIDAVNNETSAAGSDGIADNGIRIVVDNGSDIDGDGVADTAARMDTSDGLSFFDLNLDGRFGDPLFDTLEYIDADGSLDGFAETPLILASEAQQALGNSPEGVSFLFDPELDGTRELDAERDLGAATEGDLVSELLVTLTPSTLSANGINTATVRIEVLPITTGIPLDAQIGLSVERNGGVLLSDDLDARFISNDAATTSRLLSPLDPEVRLLSDGTFVLAETLIVPLLETDNFDSSASLAVTVDIVGSDDNLDTEESATESTTESDLLKVRNLVLTPSTAPLLSSVLMSGQIDLTGVSGDLETLSTKARLVWGDAIQVNGKNFASSVEDNIVTVGGVPVDNLEVNEDATQLTFTIPEGATTSPISVVVNGLGGKTAKNLVIAGEDFAIDELTPDIDSSSEATIAANIASFTIRMSRDVDTTTLDANSVFLREQVSQTPVAATLTTPDARTIVLAPNAALSGATTYELVLTSDLLADGADPDLHFDADPSAPMLTTATETAVVATYTTAAADNTAPLVSSSDPADSATGVDPRATLSVTFDEEIDVGSIADAVFDGTLKIVNQSDASTVAFDWSIDSTRTILSLTPNEPLAGLVSYQLTLPATGTPLTDRAGNALNSGTDVTVDFTTTLVILELLPRSGPVGETVTVLGGNFGTDPSVVTVTVGGIAVSDIFQVDDDFIAFDLPEDAVSGLVEVTVNAETVTSPVPFTVTLPLQRFDLPAIQGSSPIGVAVSADDSRFFVSNQGDGTIAVYNIDQLEQVDANGVSEDSSNVISVGSVPSEAKVSRDGQLLLTLDYGSVEEAGDSFFIIDAASSIGEPENESYNLVATVPVGKRPTRIATGPLGARWYVTNFLDDTLSVIGAERPFPVVGTVTTGDGPNGVAISPDGTRGFVCNFLAGTVTVFDATAFDAIGEIEVGSNPARARYSPDGRYVFVTCFGDNTLHVIDAASHVNLGFTTVNAAPAAMSFSPTGDQLYLCSRVQDTVTIYDITEDDDGLPVLTAVGDVATGRTPSGVAVTNDGSRLVVTNENDGTTSVIFLRTPVQQIVDVIDPERDDSIRSADVGQIIEIEGKNFNPTPSLNTVLFNGVPGLVDDDNSDFETLRVAVPEGATSGPLLVESNGSESNTIDFIVTPQFPKIVRTSPPKGAINVAPNTSIVARFNEPILTATSSDVRLVRMLDTFTGGVRDEGADVTGTVLLRDFNQEVVFRPDESLDEQENSNNIYKFFVFTTISDRAGNNLDRELEFTFRLRDSLGPTLIGVSYLDPDSSGINAGDIVHLEFDETVIVASDEQVSADGLVTLSDSTTLGTNVLLEPPFLPDTISSAAAEDVILLSRKVGLVLGSGADILVPGTRTAVSALTNLSGTSAITDVTGNTTLNVLADVDIAPFVNQFPTPQALAVILEDLNANNVGDAGERIGIYCNTPLTGVAAFSTADFSVSGGGTLGTGASVELEPDNKRVIEITLGSSPNMNFSNLSSFTHFITTAGPLAALVSFADVPLSQITSSGISYSVGDLPNGPEIAADPIYVDANTTVAGPSAGDVILVTFDTPINVGPAAANTAFVMAVAEDRFGSGATIESAQSDFGGVIASADVPNTCVIRLGANPILRPDGGFDPNVLTFGSSSGLNINPNIPIWTINNVLGVSAVPSATPHALTSSDTTGPLILSAKFKDKDNSGSASVNDVIELTFDEPTDRNGATVGSFELTSGSDFGSGALLVKIGEKRYDIKLGSAPTLALDGSVDITPVVGSPMADKSGNLVQNVAVAITVSVVGAPSLQAAFFEDLDANGIDEGDSLTLRFNQSMVLSASALPESLFLLTNPIDSFGSGATVDFAVVTQSMIDAGLTTLAVGQESTRLLTVTLGLSPVLSNLHGTSPYSTLPYTVTLDSLLESGLGVIPYGLPSGLFVNYGTSLAFSESQIAAAVNLSSGSNPDVFESVEFDLDGDLSADVTFNIPLSSAEVTAGAISDLATKLSNGLNFAFINAGYTARAFVQTLPGNQREVVIVDNGQGIVGSSGSVSGTELSTTVSGVANSGIVDELRNLAFAIPRGGVDIFASSDGVAPVLLSATLDDTTGDFIELVFDKPVEAIFYDEDNDPRPANDFLKLPVTDDIFGTPTSLQSGDDAFTLIVQLGADAVVTAAGIFDSATLDAGSPSGVRARQSVIFDFAGNPVSNTSIVDIEGGSVVAPPTVLSVLPSSGPADGGTAVTISGTGFAAGATVTFGTASATGVVVNSDTSISAITPAGAAGLVSVTVTTTAGSGVLANAYTYEEVVEEATDGTPQLTTVFTDNFAASLSARYGHGAVQTDSYTWQNDDLMIIFGGQGASSALNDVLVFDLDGVEPVLIEGVPVLPDPDAGLPAARSDMVFVFDSQTGYIWMHGGRNGNSVFSDTWCLKPVLDPNAAVNGNFGSVALGATQAFSQSEISINGLQWEQVFSNASPGGASARYGAAAMVSLDSGYMDTRPLAVVGGANSSSILAGGAPLFLDLENPSSGWVTLTVDAGLTTLSGYNSNFVPATPSTDLERLFATSTAPEFERPELYTSEVAHDILAIYGGFSDASEATLETDFFELVMFESGGSTKAELFVASTPGQWEYAAQGAMEYVDEFGAYLIIGGRNASGGVGLGGAAFTDVVWHNVLPSDIGSLADTSLLRRYGATLIDGALAFGHDGTAPTADVTALYLDSAEEAAVYPIAAFYEPLSDAAPGATTGVDDGEELRVVFSASTNLAYLIDQEGAQLDNLLSVGDGDGDANFGTWGLDYPYSVATTLFKDDTLVIPIDTSGQSPDPEILEDLAAQDPYLDFSVNGTINTYEALRSEGDDGLIFHGKTQIAGSTSSADIVVWDSVAAVDDDLTNPLNWIELTTGVNPSVAPGLELTDANDPGVIALIDAGSSPLSLTMPDTAGRKYHQLVTFGPVKIESAGDIVMQIDAPSTGRAPKLMIGGGLLSMATSTVLHSDSGTNSPFGVPGQISGSRIVAHDIDFGTGGLSAYYDLYGNIFMDGDFSSGGMLVHEGVLTFFGSDAQQLGPVSGLPYLYAGEIRVAKAAGTLTMTNYDIVNARRVGVFDGALDLTTTPFEFSEIFFVGENGAVTASALQTTTFLGLDEGELISAAPAGSVSLGGLVVDNAYVDATLDYFGDPYMDAITTVWTATGPSSAQIDDVGALQGVSTGLGGSTNAAGFFEGGQMLSQDLGGGLTPQSDLIQDRDATLTAAFRWNGFGNGQVRAYLADATDPMVPVGNVIQFAVGSGSFGGYVEPNLWYREQAFASTEYYELWSELQLVIYADYMSSGCVVYVDDVFLSSCLLVAGSIDFQDDVEIGQAVSLLGDEVAVVELESEVGVAVNVSVAGTVSIVGILSGEMNDEADGGSFTSTFTGSDSMEVPQGSLVVFDSTNANTPSLLRFSEHFDVAGEFDISNVLLDFAPAVAGANNHIHIDRRARFSATNCVIDSCQLNPFGHLTASDLTDPVGLKLLSVTMTGQPDDLGHSLQPTYIHFDESEMEHADVIALSLIDLAADLDASGGTDAVELDDLAIDFDGDGQKDITFSTPMGGDTYSTPITAAELSGLANELTTELASVGLSFISATADDIDFDGALDTFKFVSSIPNFFARYGDDVGILSGGDALGDILAPVARLGDFSATELIDVAFVDGGGAVHSITVNNASGAGVVTVNGWLDSGAGGLDFDDEVDGIADANNGGGPRDVNGVIEWNRTSTALFAVEGLNDEVFVVQPTSGVPESHVIDTLVLQAGATGIAFHELRVFVESSFVDDDVSMGDKPVIGYTLFQDNGDGEFGSGDTPFANVATGSILDDNPVLEFSGFNGGSGFGVSAGDRFVFHVVADLTASAPEGSNLKLRYELPQLVGYETLIPAPGVTEISIENSSFLIDDGLTAPEVVKIPGGATFPVTSIGGSALFGVTLNGAPTVTNVLVRDSGGDGVIGASELDTAFSAVSLGGTLQGAVDNDDLLIESVTGSDFFTVQYAENVVVAQLYLDVSFFSAFPTSSPTTPGVWEFGFDITGNAVVDENISFPDLGVTDNLIDDLPGMVDALATAFEPYEIAVWIDVAKNAVVFAQPNDAALVLGSFDDLEVGILTGDDAVSDVIVNGNGFHFVTPKFRSSIDQIFGFDAAYETDIVESLPNQPDVAVLNVPTVATDGFKNTFFDFGSLPTVLGRTVTIGDGLTPTIRGVLLDSTSMLSGTTDALVAFGRNLDQITGPISYSIFDGNSAASTGGSMNVSFDGQLADTGADVVAGFMDTYVGPFTVEFSATLPSGASVSWKFHEVVASYLEPITLEVDSADIWRDFGLGPFALPAIGGAGGYTSYVVSDVELNGAPIANLGVVGLLDPDGMGVIDEVSPGDFDTNTDPLDIITFKVTVTDASGNISEPLDFEILVIDAGGV